MSNVSVADLSAFRGIALTPEQVAMLRLLAGRVPESVVIGGRIVSARSDLLDILMDGKIDAQDLIEQFMRFMSAPKAAPKPPGPPERDDDTPERGEAAEVTVSQIVATVTGVHGPKRGANPLQPLDFHIDESQEPHVVVLDSGHTDLDDGSRVTVELEILDRDGFGIRVDLDPRNTPAGQVNHPEMLGRFRFEVRALGGTVLGSIGGAGLHDNAHVEGPAHWLDPDASKGIGAWRRSGGVYAQAIMTSEMKGRGRSVVRVVYVPADGGPEVVSNETLLPEVR